MPTQLHSPLARLRHARGSQWQRTATVVVVAAGFVAGLALLWAQGNGPFHDGISYYVIDLGRLYDYAVVSMQAYGAYRYAPILAQALDPFGGLPLLVFIAGWTTLLVAALIAMGRGRWWLLLGVPFVVLELYAGNVHLLIAAAVVVGFRWPGAWAFVALTKVTPFIGVLWFGFRREWRRLAIALATTGVIVVVGAAIAPDLWREWLNSLRLSASQPSVGYGGPFLARLPVAILLIAWAAPKDMRWLMPVAVILLLPNIWLHSLSILAASVVLWPGFRQPVSAHEQLAVGRFRGGEVALVKPVSPDEERVRLP